MATGIIRFGLNHYNSLATFIYYRRLISLYRKIQTLREILQRIREQGVPDDRAEGISVYVNQVMENGTATLSVEIMNQFYNQPDEGRRYELENGVRISLNKIANRIDQGFHLEVRAEPPTKPEAGNEANMNAIKLIREANKDMQFLKLEGPPILKLPEQGEKSEVRKIPKPKRKR